ncbi:MAG TPA: amidohydrolase family protein [Nitrososphaeraceae archaeon]|nr:amidohydrolase family protein [Nitrososphaeraceae archaeon]
MQNVCDVLITDASGVVIPKLGIIQANILIEDGKIKDFAKSVENIQATKIINANGKYILPGVIDPHVHYGVFTPIDHAAKTESRSAAVGGVTTMMRMVRLSNSYHKIIDHLNASKCTHYIDYSIHASILNTSQLAELQFLKEKMGISSFKIYMNLGADLNHIFVDLEPGTFDIKDCEINMTKAFVSSIIQEASKGGYSTILIHAEDPALCSKYSHEAKNGKRANRDNKAAEQLLTEIKPGIKTLQEWSDSRPAISEALSISNAAEHARKHHANMYFVHIGSTLALDAILLEKVRGQCNLYIETCPHYLTHTTDFNDIRGKVVPPLRSKSDVQSIWSALENGVIDTVGTDHVANRLSMKLGDGDIWSALAGFPGLATMLPVLLSNGVNEGRISIERLSEVTSYNTARIFNLYPRKGTIGKGSDADLSIIDLDLEQKVTPELLQSYSDYSIYDGMKMRGWPVMTMVRGNVIMEDGLVNDDALGYGEFVARSAGQPKDSLE